MDFDLLIRKASIVTMNPDLPYVENGSIGISDGKIQTISSQLLPSCKARKVIDANRAVVTPGFIDCHTHVIFGGNRSHEFEARLKGASYETIARSGGGILSTVRETRSASFEQLREAAEQRLKTMIQKGTTTVEIKSGYGLDMKSEIKMLEVAKSMAERLPVSIMTTFLGAHAIPPEFKATPTPA